ncbi:hypothetical protein N7527_004774 [Penicillium freii]|nr:hypothetical protein N7527_004774 [Penicillium freii]
MDDLGKTSFWWAAAGGQLEIVRLLAMQRDMKKRLIDLEGTTAYDIFEDHGHVGVRLFLRSP